MTLGAVRAAAPASYERRVGGVLAIVEPRHGAAVARRAIDVAAEAAAPLTLLMRPMRHDLLLAGCAAWPPLHVPWTEYHAKRFDYAEGVVADVPWDLALHVVRSDRGLRRCVLDILAAAPISSAVVAGRWKAQRLGQLGVEVITV